jgi:WD40 repeat protein
MTRTPPRRRAVVGMDAEVAGTTTSPPEAPNAHASVPGGYDAFISYSQAADGELAPALRTGLQSLGKPWYRRRALRVFQDKTSLSATPELWPTIEDALAQSRYFVLLASPDAAASRWVDQEVGWWRTHRSTSTMLICLTGGELVWDEASQGFDPARTTALPPSALGSLAQEPLWVDLRWAHEAKHVSLRDPRFRECLADLAAPIRGLPKDDLIGEDIRQHRRTLRLAQGGATLLALLTALAVLAAFIAVGQRNTARKERNNADHRARLATSRQLAGEADTKVSTDPQLATLLSLAAFRIADTVEARRSLLTQLQHREHVIGFLNNQATQVTDLAFHPTKPILASGDYDGQVILWDLVRRVPLASLAGHVDPQYGKNAGILSIAFSPDGRLLAVASDDEMVVVWDVDRRVKAATLANLGFSVTFSPDGQTLASGNRQGVSLWDLDRGVQSALLPQSEGVNQVEFSPNGRILAAGASEPVTILWDVRRRRRLATVPSRGETLSFSPDGRMLATSGPQQRSINLWDMRRRSHIAALQHDVRKTGRATPYWVDSVTFSPDGSMLASGGDDKTVVLWNVRRRVRQATLVGHGDSVSAVAFNRDGSMLASGDGSGAITLWNPQQPYRGLELPSGSPEQIAEVAFSPDGRFLAGAGDLSRVVLWDARSRRRVAVLARRPGYGAQVTSLAYSPDGRILASGDFDGELTLWDTQRRVPLHTFSGNGGLVVDAISFSPDGRWIASKVFQGLITIRDVSQREVVATLGSQGGEAAPRDILFSPYGGLLAAGGEDGRIVLWDALKRAVVATFAQPQRIHRLAFTPDGRVLAAGGDKTIVLWDAVRRVQLATLTQAENVVDLAFSPDGRVLAAGGEDGKVVLWDTAQRARLGTLSLPNREEVSAGISVSAVFGPDGRTLAAGAGEQAAFLWDVDATSWKRRLCAIASRALTKDEWNTYLPGWPYTPICD